MYTEKLESLTKEYAATMEHANEVLNEIVDTILMQEMLNVYNELNYIEQIVFVQSILDGTFFDNLVSKLRTDSEKREAKNHCDDISVYIRFLEAIS